MFQAEEGNWPPVLDVTDRCTEARGRGAVATRAGTDEKEEASKGRAAGTKAGPKEDAWSRPGGTSAPPSGHRPVLSDP